ncbi:hypothetical protein [Candidatus Uabimicrobium sp. HlEnr_7]|uniref:hypothetical protein n=1 Tax=Candidatus Uabimicrobium helgolandensis TaxID=3095367 RepID=UPI003558B7AE
MNSQKYFILIIYYLFVFIRSENCRDYIIKNLKKDYQSRNKVLEKIRCNEIVCKDDNFLIFHLIKILQLDEPLNHQKIYSILQKKKYHRLSWFQSIIKVIKNSSTTFDVKKNLMTCLYTSITNFEFICSSFLEFLDHVEYELKLHTLEILRYILLKNKDVNLNLSKKICQRMYSVIVSNVAKELKYYSLSCLVATSQWENIYISKLISMSQQDKDFLHYILIIVCEAKTEIQDSLIYFDKACFDSNSDFVLESLDVIFYLKLKNKNIDLFPILEKLLRHKNKNIQTKALQNLVKHYIHSEKILKILNRTQNIKTLREETIKITAASHFPLDYKQLFIDLFIDALESSETDVQSYGLYGLGNIRYPIRKMVTKILMFTHRNPDKKSLKLALIALYGIERNANDLDIQIYVNQVIQKIEE